MHEWAMACDLVRKVEEAALARGAVRICGVSVTVGTLTGVIPELLQRSFEICRQGTPLDGVGLTIEVEPARARCPHCGTESCFEDFMLVCPKCQGVGLEVLSGDAILLNRLELEVEDGPVSARGESHV